MYIEFFHLRFFIINRSLFVDMKFYKSLLIFILILSSNPIFAQNEDNMNSGFSLFASYVNQKGDNNF